MYSRWCGGGGDGAAFTSLLSSWHEISDDFNERHTQGSLSAGTLGRLTRANVPPRHDIVVAVQGDSDAFSACQAEAGRDGRTAWSPAQVDNWRQTAATVPVQQGGAAMTNRSAHKAQCNIIHQTYANKPQEKDNMRPFLDVHRCSTTTLQYLTQPEGILWHFFSIAAIHSPTKCNYSGFAPVKYLF